MEQAPIADRDTLLAQLSDLSQQYQAIAAPYDAQIKDLEVARNDATAALIFQMETLQALIRPWILEAKRTSKVPFMTVTYVHKDEWDKGLLFTMAKEVPAIMQAHKDASFVRFNKTTR